MLYNTIKEVIKKLDPDSITEKRKKTLQSLIDFLQSHYTNGKVINLNFICTHNSRRSHLAQVWAQALAHHFNIHTIYCYSGGTVATAIFPMVLKTLENSGFKTHILADGMNPVYAIKFAPNQQPVLGFSKSYNHEFNPKSQFLAVMTCSEADEACPIILGAENRLALTYEDPKLFDDSPLQETKYQERSTQIATELLYVFSQLKKWR